MEPYLDDRCIIPDDIKRMSSEERLKEIEKIELAIKEQKKNFVNTQE